MANKKGTGLLMVWCEVPADVEDEFNRWYNEEHIEERLSIPGILSAARYEAVVSGPKHLAVYELESSAVMESDEYLKVRSNPTEWSKRMSPEYTATTYIRNVYEMIHPAGLTDAIAKQPHGSRAPDRAHGHTCRGRGRVEPLVRHRLRAQLRDRGGREAWTALHRGRRRSEVLDDVRIRPHGGIQGGGVAQTADRATQTTRVCARR